MEDTNELIQQRKQKLEALKELGIEPYGKPFDFTAYTADILGEFEKIDAESLAKQEKNVTIAGRIMAMRNFGKAAFAHIQDNTGKIQVYFKKDVLGDRFKLLKKLDIGDIVGCTGVLFRTKTDELTIEISGFELLSKSLRPLPEKWHGLRDIEQRYRQRYVDLIVNPSVKDTVKKRSQIIKAIRDYLEKEGFIEVETPMMQQIPGGATAKPFKTHHNALDIDLYLRIAPELYLKRLIVGGFEKVFELNRNFRNEGISTKHNPEFTMLEFYIAYKDYNYLMTFTEGLFEYMARKVVGSLNIPYGNDTIDLTPPWPRIPLYDALTDKGVPENILRDRKKAFEWAKNNGVDVKAEDSLGKIIDEIFSEKVEPSLIQPTYIIDYPIELSPLAKRKKDDSGLVERFELFIAAREIVNAFSELNDPADQRERFLQQVEDKERGDDEAHWMDEDYVRALEYGMPPAAGEGIGIDRLVMLLTNAPSIRDVIIFPQLKPEK
ncbi:MAG: lysine--tRNA ligase [Nitrospirota bacterium]|nr:MAG: lysine--tRNA ligase [Nitrospirota bacterium]